MTATLQTPDARKARPVVSIFGSSATQPDTAEYENARRLAQLLAQAGTDIACGGYGGIMEAVSRGATEGGGGALGYTLPPMSGRKPNAFLSEDRPQATLYDRLHHLIHSSQALIAVNGGIGTVVEVFLAWNELYLNLLQPRPLVLVGASWRQAIDGLSALLEITDAHMEHITFADDIDHAVVQLRNQGVLA